MKRSAWHKEKQVGGGEFSKRQSRLGIWLMGNGATRLKRVLWLLKFHYHNILLISLLSPGRSEASVVRGISVSAI